MKEKSKKSVILLVEDEQMLSDLLVRRLEKEGYAVHLARDGKEALDIIRTTTLDIILLDLCLPRESGFETMEQLAQEKDNHHAPIIIISNLSSSESIARAKELGAAEYFVKSKISYDEIVEHVKEFLKEKTAENA